VTHCCFVRITPCRLPTGHWTWRSKRAVLVDDYDRMVAPVAPFDPAVSVRTFVLTRAGVGRTDDRARAVRRIRAEPQYSR